MRTILILFLLFILAAATFPQKKKRPPVVGRVTVEAKLPPVEKKEEAKLPWTEFKSEELDFAVKFPASSDDIFDDHAETVKVFRAYTDRATYSVAVRDLGYFFDRNRTDEILDGFLDGIYNFEKPKIIERKKIRYGDFTGRQVIFDVEDTRNFAKVFAHGDKLYIVSVALKIKNYKPDFDQWAFKFLDSFDLLIQPETKG